ncbi:MAG: hypothetical protein N2379_00985 [Verrucomicrobiae bacterium]|nr:hypothetical protein [Verrucomicrobiae bacterium]
MLTCESAILVAIEAGPGIGRTALQKVLYFAMELGLLDVSFEAHYYGPYSREVASTLLNLVAAGWVRESGEAWPDGSPFGERRRYSYRLSPAGKTALRKLVPQDSAEAQKLRKLVRLCKLKANLDFDLLALAAKIWFLRSALGKALKPEEVQQQASIWGWQVRQEDIPSVADLLESLRSFQSGS